MVFWFDLLFTISLKKFPHLLTETGGLFRLAVRMMQVFSSCKTDFTKLVNLLAMYFQVSNDYNDNNKDFELFRLLSKSLHFYLLDQRRLHKPSVLRLYDK